MREFQRERRGARPGRRERARASMPRFLAVLPWHGGSRRGGLQGTLALRKTDLPRADPRRHERRRDRREDVPCIQRRPIAPGGPPARGAVSRSRLRRGCEPLRRSHACRPRAIGADPADPRRLRGLDRVHRGEPVPRRPLRSGPLDASGDGRRGRPRPAGAGGRAHLRRSLRLPGASEDRRLPAGDPPPSGISAGHVHRGAAPPSRPVPRGAGGSSGCSGHLCSGHGVPVRSAVLRLLSRRFVHRDERGGAEPEEPRTAHRRVPGRERDRFDRLRGEEDGGNLRRADPRRGVAEKLRAPDRAADPGGPRARRDGARLLHPDHGRSSGLGRLERGDAVRGRVVGKGRSLEAPRRGGRLLRHHHRGAAPDRVRARETSAPTSPPPLRRSPADARPASPRRRDETGPARILEAVLERRSGERPSSEASPVVG